MYKKRNSALSKEGVKIKGLSVNVHNGNVDVALRKLKKRVDDDGRLKVYADKKHYEKPSETKRKKAKQAVQRNKRRLREERMELDKYSD